MRTAIIGSRNFEDYDLMCKILKEYNITHIVSGGAKGADRLAEKYARENKIPVTLYLPDWVGLGNRAGYERNKKIINDSELVIAFWDQVSKGTKHSIDLARARHGVILVVVNFVPPAPKTDTAAIF